MTSELPDDSVIRAIVVCPECIDADRVAFPNPSRDLRLSRLRRAKID